MIPHRPIVAFAALVAIAVATAVVAAGLPAQQSKPAATATSKPAQVGTFGWRIPAKVVVTEDTLKKGQRAKMRYTLHVQPVSGEKRHVVTMRNWAFLEVNGHDITSPRMQRLVAPALSLTAAVPDMVIDRKGNFLQTTGLDQLTKRTLEFMAKHKKLTDIERQRVETTMAEPTTRAAMEAAVGSYWNTWVGAWVDWDLAAGKKFEAKTKFPLGQFELPATVTLIHHGPVKGKPGYVRLTQRTVSKGEAARKAYLAAMRQMLGKALAAEGRKLEDDAISELNVESRIEVVTRLSDLRPLSSVYEKKISIRMKGAAKARTQFERRKSTFDWKD